MNDAFFTYKDLEHEINNLPFSGIVDDAMIQDIIEKWTVEEILFQEFFALPQKTKSEINQNFDSLQRIYFGEQFLEQLMGNEITISDENILGFYKKNINRFVFDDYHVLVDIYRCDSTDAIEISKTLQKEKPVSIPLKNRCFFKVAWISKNSVRAPFHRLLFPKNRKKTTIGPIKQSGMFWVAKILERKSPGDTKPLDFVQDEIYQQLLIEKKNSLRKHLIDSLKTRSKIYIPRRKMS